MSAGLTTLVVVLWLFVTGLMLDAYLFFAYGRESTITALVQTWPTIGVAILAVYAAGGLGLAWHWYER